MRHIRHIAVLAVVAFIGAACSSGSGGGGNGATTPTGPPTPVDTSKKVTPPPVHLDSLNRGIYDQNNVLHLYPDSLVITIPFQGASGSTSFSNVIAYTSSGIVTDPASMSGMFGAMVLSSDTPSVITPGGNCNGQGWPCMTFTGVFGRATVTFTMGGKSIAVPVIVN